MTDIDTLLIDDFNVSSTDLEKAKSYQNKFGGRLEKLLVNMGSFAEEALPSLYSKLLALPLLSDEELIKDWDLPKEASDLNLEMLYEHNFVPYEKQNDKWVFLCSDPLIWEVNQYLVEKDIDAAFILTDKSTTETLIADLSGKVDDGAVDLSLSDFEEDKLKELATEAPTVNLLNGLIAKGIRINASDMHLEPVKSKYRVRYRVDGVLNEGDFLPAALQLAVVSRIKILSSMDVAEKRRPQDGKIETRVSNVDLDIRVSVLPLNKGESVVMRFLRKDSITYDMDILGISPDIRQKLNHDLHATAGVILLTGPTGSGKTTSLYTFLNELNSDDVKIITLEDPVEYQLDGINQVQVNSDIGFDFAKGLRSIVRQDPDIIMLGEIRDQETARIAMQSALTGHLVFSTVHTNDAPSAYTRLLDLGVEEFLLDAAIISILAQRLVRKVCPECSVKNNEQQHLVEKYDLLKLSQKYGHNEINLVQAVGCESCSHTGYRGRMAIIEYLPCNEDVRALEKDNYFIPEAKKLNAQLGNRTLLEDGLLRAIQGLTTVDEVLRVCA